MGLLSAITTCFAIVAATVLGAEIGSLLAFAAWSATLALAFGQGPRVWRSRLEYFVTDDQVIYRRGSFQRTIDRRQISYARIHWDPQREGIGDLELVRAVPTGALRRRLVVTLPALQAPDRVWALIRDVPLAEEPSPPLTQRLSEDERILWAATPAVSLRDLLPSEPRNLASLLLGLVVALALVRQIAIAAPLTLQMRQTDVSSLPFLALVSAFALSSFLLAIAAGWLFYFGLVQPARAWFQTRYFITNQRVLIQRGREELSLDRSFIVDFVTKPARRGGHDLFLVLDGPNARGLATSGLFSRPHRKDSLVPVLRAVLDPEAVGRILRGR